jgi:hypothetical protein
MDGTHTRFASDLAYTDELSGPARWLPGGQATPPATPQGSAPPSPTPPTPTAPSAVPEAQVAIENAAKFGMVATGVSLAATLLELSGVGGRETGRAARAVAIAANVASLSVGVYAVTINAETKAWVKAAVVLGVANSATQLVAQFVRDGTKGK